MMGLLILRVLFILVASGAGYSIMSSGVVAGEEAGRAGIWTFFGTVGLAFAVIIGDMLVPKKRVDWISSVYFGVLVGLLMTAAIGFAVAPLWPLAENADKIGRANFMLLLCIGLCYVCTSFLIQTRDDFRFIIPYVEFRKNLKGNRPLVLDTSVVIDGRIADVMETMIVDSRLVMPRFAINELQRIADSADRGRRTRGRRGLDILNRLQKMKGVEMQIDDTDLPEFRGQPVDLKLVALTRHLEGKLVTNDYNLNKVAKIQGVDVINLNDLANAMKPVFLPGERIDVDIAKMGEEANQGIGYLDDGTMVVVDNGRDHVNEKTVVTVTSVLQTSAGRMIFGRYEFTTKKTSGSGISQDVLAVSQLGQMNRENQNNAVPVQPQLSGGLQSVGKNGEVKTGTAKYKK
ncbi:PIN/TRAM domain-containing protein [Planctomycetales bacterium]|nr:PIN/TRAM domain-containing protein [Planctomycetales bacterium]GHT34916.1 PIN/TRAM domain-containing protein [Planctomycetales bacterium]